MNIETVEQDKITTRLTYRLADGLQTRASLIERPEKTILCISSQIGCTGACKFCSAWQTPIVRNLDYIEMLSMIILAEVLGRRPLLISFMGTGEPLANIDNIVRLVDFLKDLDPNIRIALSTSGYNLEQLHKIPTHVKLQFSVISPFPNVHKKLLPHGESLTRVIHAIKAWKGAKEINTTLIKGINNDELTMKAFARISLSTPIHIKLNYFHAVNRLEPAGNEEQCLTLMQAEGADVELYKTDGEEINAACGQFELTS